MAAASDKDHRRAKGLEPVHVWVRGTDKTAWQAFAEKRGQSLTEVIVEALRRHLAYPPPVPEPVTQPPPVPLPDAAPAPGVKRGRGRPKKKT